MNPRFLSYRVESSQFACDRLQVHRISGTEGISRLFSFEIAVTSTDGALDVDAAIGSEAALVLERDGEKVRHIHGVVSRVVDHYDTEAKTMGYRLTLVPCAWRLTLVETQDIFRNLSVPDIIKSKLELVGMAAEDFEFRLRESYPVREFVVQYGESDFAFICRLAEHIGISFFFEGHETCEKMVFTDHPDGFRPRDGAEKVAFRARGEEREVFALESTTNVVPANYMVNDYNYRTPLLPLTSTFELPSGYAGGVFEYGGHFKTPEEGVALARVRAQERDSRRRVFDGKSDVAPFSAGAKTTLEGHPRGDSMPLLIVEVEHHGRQSVALHGAGGSERNYENAFRAIPAEVVFRPARVTPKPRIYGVVTGIVVGGVAGASNEFACIDEEGRYNVQFLFDHAYAAGVKHPRPVRMAQPHAGPDYGMHFPLKPGVEVLVAFIDGDPDRPLIVGAVPNPVTPSPVKATNGNQNRIKTVSGILVEFEDGSRR